GPRPRRGGNPHVPGDVERPLLAGDLVAGQEPVHDPDRDRELPVRVHDAVAAADGGERAGDRADPPPLHRVPALLRRGCRGRRGEGMTLRRALGVAAADLYHQAWRLLIVNTLLGAGLVLVMLACSALRSAIL